MLKMLKVIKNNKPIIDYFNLSLKNSKLIKKAGDDKLVISLILIAVGVVLCFLYRNQIMDVLSKALVTLNEKVDSMFTSTQPLSVPSTTGY